MKQNKLPLPDPTDGLSQMQMKHLKKTKQNSTTTTSSISSRTHGAISDASPCAVTKPNNGRPPQT
jgi:hypothetical protein